MFEIIVQFEFVKKKHFQTKYPDSRCYSFNTAFDVHKMEEIYTQNFDLIEELDTLPRTAASYGAEKFSKLMKIYNFRE